MKYKGLYKLYINDRHGVYHNQNARYDKRRSKEQLGQG